MSELVNVVVCGAAGTGKSTYGAALAQAMRATFVEADEFHPDANIAKMQAGEPLTDADRWPWLDSLREKTQRLNADGAAVVMACSALRRSYRERLVTQQIRTVFLQLVVAESDLVDRVAARPNHFMPPSLVSSQAATLEPLTADEDGATISAEGTPGEVLGRVAQALLDMAVPGVTPTTLQS